jgi:hypothetical protein
MDQNMDQRFCDGVEEVSITSGIVRIDFFHYTAGERAKDGRPPRLPSHRVLLSPEAFVQTYTALEQVVKQLQDKGLLQRKGAAGSGKGTPAKGKSPNF